MTLERRPDLLWERLGRSVALLDRRDGMAHSLDGAAAVVWLECEGVTRRSEVAQRSVERGFDATEVASVIESMVERGLLVTPNGLDRRTLLRRSASAVAAGAVLSIVLPDVAAAASAGSSLYTNTSGYSLGGATNGPGTVDAGNNDYPQPKIVNLTATFPGSAPATSYIWLTIPSASSVPAIVVDWTDPSPLAIDLADLISLNFDPSLEDDETLKAQITANRDAWIAATSIRADFGAPVENTANWLGKAFGPT